MLNPYQNYIILSINKQMNVKKFAQDKAKKMKYQKYLKENKQNLYSVDDSKFKQFSVDLHKLSMEEYPRRNLVKEEISVFLQNHSQNNRTFNHDRNVLEAELRKLIRKLDQSDGSMKEFFELEMEESQQIKTQEIRKLMGVLSKKLCSEPTRSSLASHNSNTSAHPTVSRYNSSKVLSSQSVTPYLKQQITAMQQRLRVLQEEKNQYKEFKNIEKSQKDYIKHTLENVYKRQMEEVYQLEQLAKMEV